ncbi:hypothetical protein [Paracoccus sp. (in: a-proteobacteria)]|uniref:hypothetical protein n=1 Tax=Paracoccus sp. TaxID=267 RepID=UPI00272C58FB|nr:hypothetical protein [Paracoccus sp. (in: a-proteobacteria)]
MTTEPTNDEALEKTGTICTDRFEAVRYRYGHDFGDTFGEGSDYDGLALTVECADAADAQAMLDAISWRPLTKAQRMEAAPHVPARFIDDLAEYGSREELVAALQREWNENCRLRAVLLQRGGE